MRFWHHAPSPALTGAWSQGYLNDVAVGTLGVGAHVDREKGGGPVGPRHHLQNLHEVALVPGPGDIPPANLQETGMQGFGLVPLWVAKFLWL